MYEKLFWCQNMDRRSHCPLLLGFIDDRWIVTSRLGQFQKDMSSFGILKWNVDDPIFCGNYLGLVPTVNNGKIHSKTY